jgi:nucleotide-binding universal stress UspA family protein
MKRVLIPVDGSPQSLEAVRATVREGRSAIERIDLVNVQPLFHRHISRWVPKATRDAWRAERSALALEPARRIVAHSGIPFGVHTLAGPMDRAIADAARALAVDEVAFMPRKSMVERLAIPAGLGFVALLIFADE